MSIVKNIQKLFEEKIRKREKLKLSLDNKSSEYVTVGIKNLNFPSGEVSFESDDITTFTDCEVLDTTDPLNIAKYKNNLKLLVEFARQDGRINKFALIRNDDFFPSDWKWYVSCSDTAMELEGSILTYELRRCIAMQNTGMPTGLDVDNFIFNDLLIPDEKIKEQLDLLDKSLGRILRPTHFRSTKHFTVNTPLSYTGEYNFVDSDRTFTVIDDMTNFLNSKYGYSASYRDAYLDVTHEPLAISENAIVLIEEEKYKRLLENEEMVRELGDRKVIVYRGDSAVAINMILTEKGILPSRPGNCYTVYDDDVLKLLESSMQELCASNNLTYNQGHGNLDGKGGHFTDNYDSLNHEHECYKDEFLNFLKSRLPDCRDVLSPIIFKDSVAAIKAIEVIGTDRLLSAIDEYNKTVTAQFKKQYKSYKENRMTVTPEISSIFKTTVRAIDLYYQENDGSLISESDKNLIQMFYHSRNVENQLLAATTLCQKWGITLLPNLQESDQKAKNI